MWHWGVVIYKLTISYYDELQLLHEILIGAKQELIICFIFKLNWSLNKWRFTFYYKCVGIYRLYFTIRNVVEVFLACNKNYLKNI